MYVARIGAEIRNSVRPSKHARVWTWRDLHPMHAGERNLGATGRQVITTLASWFPMQYAEGFGPDSIP